MSSRKTVLILSLIIPIVFAVSFILDTVNPPKNNMPAAASVSASAPAQMPTSTPSQSWSTTTYTGVTLEQHYVYKDSVPEQDQLTGVTVTGPMDLASLCMATLTVGTFDVDNPKREAFDIGGLCQEAHDASAAGDRTTCEQDLMQLPGYVQAQADSYGKFERDMANQIPTICADRAAAQQTHYVGWPTATTTQHS